MLRRRPARRRRSTVPHARTPWELRAVAVEPASQGQGLGRRMLVAVLDDLRARSVRRVIVGTAVRPSGRSRSIRRPGFDRCESSATISARRWISTRAAENGIAVRDMIWMDRSLDAEHLAPSGGSGHGRDASGGRCRRTARCSSLSGTDPSAHAISSSRRRHPGVRSTGAQLFTWHRASRSSCSLCDDGGAIRGFMGMSGSKMERCSSLGFSAAWRGRRAGPPCADPSWRADRRRQRAERPARAFYEACGFVLEGRSDVDDWRPYLLHMRLRSRSRMCS
jgi:GNAT superfamily N-acetyltransferase